MGDKQTTLHDYISGNDKPLAALVALVALAQFTQGGEVWHARHLLSAIFLVMAGLVFWEIHREFPWEDAKGILDVFGRLLAAAMMIFFVYWASDYYQYGIMAIALFVVSFAVLGVFYVAMESFKWLLVRTQWLKSSKSHWKTSTLPLLFGMAALLAALSITLYVGSRLTPRPQSAPLSLPCPVPLVCK